MLYKHWPQILKSPSHQSSFSLNEENGSGEIGVVLSEDVDSKVRLSIVLEDGTATSCPDIRDANCLPDFLGAGPYRLTIPNGQTEASLTVGLFNDSEPEGTETFYATITRVWPKGVNISTTLGSVPVHIEDSDQISMSLDNDVYRVSESDGQARINVTIEANHAPVGRNLRPRIQTIEEQGEDAAKDGKDYTATDKTVRLRSGHRLVVVPIPLLDDDLPEGFVGSTTQDNYVVKRLSVEMSLDDIGVAIPENEDPCEAARLGDETSLGNKACIEIVEDDAGFITVDPLYTNVDVPKSSRLTKVNIPIRLSYKVPRTVSTMYVIDGCYPIGDVPELTDYSIYYGDTIYDTPVLIGELTYPEGTLIQNIEILAKYQNRNYSGRPGNLFIRLYEPVNGRYIIYPSSVGDDHISTVYQDVDYGVIVDLDMSKCFIEEKVEPLDLQGTTPHCLGGSRNEKWNSPVVATIGSGRRWAVNGKTDSGLQKCHYMWRGKITDQYGPKRNFHRGGLCVGMQDARDVAGISTADNYMNYSNRYAKLYGSDDELLWGASCAGEVPWYDTQSVCTNKATCDNL